MEGEAFIPSLELNEAFFNEVVRPLLATHFPALRYSAARLGLGSEVLGYDTPMSMDHAWGIQFQIFLADVDVEGVGTAVHEMLRQNLPYQYKGFSTHFGPMDEKGVRFVVKKERVPVDHNITITTIAAFFDKHMRLNPYEAWQPVEWLTTSQQLLLGVTRGRVFTDGLRELEPIRQKLAYFPHDVWLYLLACQWARIGQEEHFVGRTGFVGDDIGSRLLASRLVHDVMLLCFLMEKQYAPYPKWFGTAFAELDCAAVLSPILQAVLAAETWQEREMHLCAAYSFVAEMHNRQGITAPLRTDCVPFHERPFQVIDAEHFESAIRKQIKDERIKLIKTSIGSIDQYSNSTDLRSYPQLHRRLAALYEGGENN